MCVYIYITYQIKKCVYNKKACVYVYVGGCFDKYISAVIWPPQIKILGSAPAPPPPFSFNNNDLSEYCILRFVWLALISEIVYAGVSYVGASRGVCSLSFWSLF